MAKEENTFFQHFLQIQQEYKSSRNEYNKFGGFKYRNAEIMLAELKPLLKKHGFIILFKDNVQLVGERYYVKSQAVISNGTDTFSADGWARETLDKKGMDTAQITGSCTTYAHKYALQSLLGIDDGEHDPDAKDNTQAQQSTTDNTNNPATIKQKNLIMQLWNKSKASDSDFLHWYSEEYGEDAKNMTSQRASEVIARIKEGKL